EVVVAGAPGVIGCGETLCDAAGVAAVVVGERVVAPTHDEEPVGPRRKLTGGLAAIGLHATASEWPQVGRPEAIRLLARGLLDPIAFSYDDGVARPILLRRRVAGGEGLEEGQRERHAAQSFEELSSVQPEMGSLEPFV